MQYRVLLLMLVGLTQMAWSQNSSIGINLPYTSPMTGQDRIRSADGVECNRQVGPREKWMEVGSFASQGTGQGADTVYSGLTGFSTTTPDYKRATVGVYAKLVVNLDKQQPQIDCSHLYEIEILRLRKELEEVQLRSKASVYNGK